MNGFFYLKAGLSSNYRIKVEKTFILKAHILTFYLCGLTLVAFFSPIFSKYIIQITFSHYLNQLPILVTTLNHSSLLLFH